MAEFHVQVTVRLELGASFTIKAKSQQAAEEKAANIIEEGSLEIASWTPAKQSEKLPDIEWSESSQDTELDSVEEA